MYLSVTGHRPNCTGGYGAAAIARVERIAYRWIDALRPELAYVGMALGWDQAVATACVSLGVPFVAVIPGLPRGMAFGDNWPRASYERYLSLLERAESIEWRPWAGAGREYYDRDRRLVELAAARLPDALLLALWSGERSGTSLTVGLAVEWSVPVWNVWGDYSDGQ
jgi:sugar phosphate isomerase/epimerase